MQAMWAHGTAQQNLNPEAQNEAAVGSNSERAAGHSLPTLPFPLRRERWDVVVVDPPSFAPSKQAVEKAKASYERVFAMAAQVTR